MIRRSTLNRILTKATKEVNSWPDHMKGRELLALSRANKASTPANPSIQQPAKVKSIETPAIKKEVEASKTRWSLLEID